jgi:hypothetical protein
MKNIARFISILQRTIETVYQGLTGNHNPFILLRIFTIIVSLSLIIGCNKKIETPPSNIAVLENSAAMKKVLMEQYGFSESSIVETDENFVCEDDMVFQKNNFYQNYRRNVSNQSAKHYRLFYTVKLPAKITLAVSTKVPKKWQQAVIEAAARWNQINLKLKFNVTISNYCPANGVTVEWRSLSNINIVAQANYPTSDGMPGKVLIINSTSLAIITNADYRRNIIAHEIGHCCAAFDHTDNPNSSSSTLLSLSTTCKGNDPNSIMVRVPKSNTYTFSNCDLEAFKKVLK